MIKSKSFQVHEFVPKFIYEEYGDNSWSFVDVRLIETMDIIKARFPLGTVTINNYFWGGSREWSGIRSPNSPYYSPNSQHTLGKALDFVLSMYSAEEVRQDIINNPHIYIHVRGLELGTSWVHLDIRNERYLVTFKA